MVTRSENDPFVSNVVRPLRAVIAGAMYDVVLVDADDCWSPTVTFHCWPLPAPTTGEQVISVCATLTTHPDAVNSPDAYVDVNAEFWYTALTGLAVAPTGPKFVPVIVT